ncbi:TPA: hypothetical protein DCW54_01865 [Candidatus Dependentiae bacterium]|nr:hypothetical protein [Candidatus Dependentiae bacterium]
MKTFLPIILWGSFCLVLPLHGFGLLKKHPKHLALVTITLPNAIQLKSLLQKTTALQAFNTDTDVITELASKTFTGPELEQTRRLLIDQYQRRQQRKTKSLFQTSDTASAAVKAFNAFLCSFVKKNKHLHQQLLAFRKLTEPTNM